MNEAKKLVLFLIAFIIVNMLPVYVIVDGLSIYIILFNNAILTLYLLITKERKYRNIALTLSVAILIIHNCFFMGHNLTFYRVAAILAINIWNGVSCYIIYKILGQKCLEELDLKENIKIIFLKILSVVIIFGEGEEFLLKVVLGLNSVYRGYNFILPDFLGYIFVFTIVYIVKTKKLHELEMSSIFFIFFIAIFLFDTEKVGLLNILNMEKSHLEYISIFILFLACILLSAEEFIILIVEDFIITYSMIRTFIESVGNAIKEYIILDMQLFYTIVMTIAFFIIISKAQNKKLVDEISQKNQRLEREIDENKQMFRKVNLLIDSMENISFIADEGGKIIYTNKAFDKITKKKNMWDIVYFKDFMQELGSGKLRKEVIVNERIIMFEVFISEFEKKHFISGVGLDITKMKLVQEKLKVAKENAEEANKAKTSLLARVSHELKTPMNTIVGINYLLKETNLDKKQKRYTKKIEKASNMLIKMIEDILDVSRSENTKMIFKEDIINLRDFIDNIVLVKEDEIEKKGLELKVEIEKNIPSYIISDEFRLQQVIINLIGNAIKFTERGYIKINVSSKHIKDFRWNLIVAIEDTGIGISEEKIGEIFEAFAQEDESINRMYGGTGLGLAICKYIVTGLGGEITVESIKGEGSKFYVEIGITEYIYGGERLCESEKGVKIEGKDKNIEFELVEEAVVEDVVEDIEEFIEYLENDIGEAFDKLEIIEEKIKNTKAKTNLSNIHKYLEEFEIDKALKEVEDLKTIFLK
ncbi:MAG: ATP-binding protein [Clostridium sp.]|uniref:sensor histidine kinase n=1 Tax=Clostridium sp. TaxID=1506 RepID=UPI003F3406D5